MLRTSELILHLKSHTKLKKKMALLGSFDPPWPAEHKWLSVVFHFKIFFGECVGPVNDVIPVQNKLGECARPVNDAIPVQNKFGECSADSQSPGSTGLEKIKILQKSGLFASGHPGPPYAPPGPLTIVT